MKLLNLNCKVNLYITSDSLKHLKTLYLRNSNKRIVFFPTQIKRITFNKSPHIFSKSKDQFEQCILKKLITFKLNKKYYENEINKIFIFHFFTIILKTKKIINY